MPEEREQNIAERKATRRRLFAWASGGTPDFISQIDSKLYGSTQSCGKENIEHEGVNARQRNLPPKKASPQFEGMPRMPAKNLLPQRPSTTFQYAAPWLDFQQHRARWNVLVTTLPCPTMAFSPTVMPHKWWPPNRWKPRASPKWSQHFQSASV